MSLISEGLKKAHLEALRQDREQRKHYLGPGRVDVPSRTPSSTTVLAAAILGASVVVAASALWLRGATPSPRSISRQVALPSRPVVTLPAVTPPMVASPAAAPVVVAPASSVVPSAASAATPLHRSLAAPAAPMVPAKGSPKVIEVRPPIAEPRRQTVSNDVLRADERVPAPAPTARRRDSLKDGETYASPIKAPGGVEVSLSGISSARGESVAIMNGNVVRAGSAVGPFVVEAIERGRVQLRYIDVHIWVTY